MHRLYSYRASAKLHIDDLVRISATLARELVGSQSRYKVTDSPDARTIRFYQAQELIDKPLGYSRTKALYGYRHLLQIMVVKFLQAESLTLKQISEVTHGASNEQLEGLLRQLALRRQSPKEQLGQLSSRMALVLGPSARADRPRSDISGNPGVWGMERYPAKRRQPGADGFGDARFKGPLRDGDWLRLPVNDLIELRVKDGFRLPEEGPERKRLVDEMLRLLGLHEAADRLAKEEHPKYFQRPVNPITHYGFHRVPGGDEPIRGQNTKKLKR